MAYKNAAEMLEIVVSDSCCYMQYFLGAKLITSFILTSMRVAFSLPAMFRLTVTVLIGQV